MKNNNDAKPAKKQWKTPEVYVLDSSNRIQGGGGDTNSHEGAETPGNKYWYVHTSKNVNQKFPHASWDNYAS